VDIRAALAKVIEGQDLSSGEMTAVMAEILRGEATPAQIGGFLVGLRMKGETVEEITAAARVMREFATHVAVSKHHLVDTCGTGGDGANTFNISTTSAFVVAAAGGRVAKHGNRSISSRSGSADVLEAAGVKIDLSPEQVAQCIETVGLGFMFAPLHHGAMKHAIGPRREIGVRSIFNLLGPLTNPAGAPNQVLGVYSSAWVRPLAEVLRNLGSEHVLVIHAEDNLDEISLSAPTQVAELHKGEVRLYTLTPEDLGFKRADSAAIAVQSVEQSLEMMHAVLANQPGAALDIVLLNAGAAIYAAGLADDLKSAIERGRTAIASGQAQEKLRSLIEFTRQF
jgi:anthranilate phosphoribosyltransferase